MGIVPMLILILHLYQISDAMIIIKVDDDLIAIVLVVVIVSDDNDK